MTLPEWFAEYEFHSDRDPSTDYAGKLTRGDVDAMVDDMELTDDEWMTRYDN